MGTVLRALAVGVAVLACGVPAAGAGKQLIGHSVGGRPIYVYEVGTPGGKPVLVVGCIHGNETAGIAVTRVLRQLTPPPGVDLWIVPVLNPDGRVRHSHGNGRGVDLNRNFPFAWKALAETERLSSGPHALSEPESRAAYELIRRIKPVVSIWFHQHLAVVDDSQGSVPLERKFALLVGLPLRKLPDYPGSATSWENHTFHGTTSFVVELPRGQLTPDQASRYANAVLSVAPA